MKTPVISIVIPAYNEEKYIGPCIEALLNQKTTVPYEIIVVDNDSNDKTAAVIHAYKTVKYVHESNRGRAKARQSGFEKAKGRYILSTDGDAQVPPNWVEKMHRYLSVQNFPVVTGPMRINHTSSLTNLVINILQPLAMYMNRYLYGSTLLCGFNFGISKKLFFESGGFDTSLNSFEDVDLGRRIEKKVKIKIQHDAPVLVSARRFDRGLFRGLFDYWKANNEYYKGTSPILSDIR